MATSFYQRQADAKKTSTLLIFLFVVAVILIVASISGATWLVSEKVLSPKTVHSLEMATGGGSSSLKLPLMTGAGALALILCGSFYKIAQLRIGGGTLVAESLGGRRISPSTNVPNERKLMNIVEEMAIASGVPVPPVFMMDEEGINAF
ncbi:MAG: peptidase M48, partial [Rubripirellula sp.]|nr:peptidase M48 [Rubripirellula sp.]